MNRKTFTVDFDAVVCNPAHMQSTGKGWSLRLKELGATPHEITILVDRLRKGMAAEIELSRIKKLAGVK